MNKVFKVIWNHATNSWVAVSELTKAKGKASSKTDERSSPSKTLLALSVAGGVLLGGSALAAVNGGTDNGSATGAGSVAISSATSSTPATATGSGSVAVGAESIASSVGAVAVGLGAESTLGEGVAIGVKAKAQSGQVARSSTAIGRGAMAGFTNPGAGAVNPATNSYTGALGFSRGGTAIGSGAIAGTGDMLARDTDLGAAASPTAAENTGWKVYDRAGMYRKDSAGNSLWTAETAKAEYEKQLAALEADPNWASKTDAEKFKAKNDILGGLVLGSGQDQTAIGVGARALGDQSIAIGGQSIAGKAAVVLGANDINSVEGSYMTMFRDLSGGRKINPCCVASYGVEGSAVLGSKASSASAFGTAMGLGSGILGNLTSAFGGTAVGSGATVGWLWNGVITPAEAGVAVGMGAHANATYATALGAASYAGGWSSSAISYKSQASGNMSIAAGAFSNVSGERSMILGANVAALETNNSVVLGTESSQVVGGVTSNVDGSTQATDARALSGASHAVTKVESAAVRASDGTLVTYEEFKGQPKNSGQYVSIGAPGAERQIKNLAAGAVDSQSTDAINGSQLYTVIKRIETGWRVSNNGNANVSTILPNDEVNFVNGTGTTAVVTPWTDAEGRTNANVTFNVNTTSLAASNGSKTADGDNPNTAPNGQVSTPANPNAFATAGDIANAINNSGWRTNATNPTGTSKEILVNPGDLVLFKAGTNLQVAQTKNADNEVEYTYSTVMNPTFANVTASNMTVGPANSPIQIGQDSKGNPANTITGLDSTLPKTDNTTASQPSPFSATNPADQTKAATLGDVLNAGWNLQTNGQPLDFVKPYDTVNISAGTGIKITSGTDGNVSNIQVSLATGASVEPQSGADTQPTGKVQVKAGDTPTGIISAGDVANAINGSGWRTNATNPDTSGTTSKEVLVNPGDLVLFKAGKNITVEQTKNADDEVEYTYATAENVSFNNVDTNTLTLGNSTNPEQPVVNFKTEKATPTVTMDKDGNPTANSPAPTSALNLSDSAGNPVQLKGVASSLNVTTPVTSSGDTVLDLTNADPTSVVTAADLKNYGWIVHTPADQNGTVVNNAEVVNFIGKNGINVTSVANGTNGNWDVVVEAVKPTYTKDNKDGSSAISFNNGNGTSSNVVTDPVTGQTTVSFDVNQTSGDVNENGVSSVKDPNAFLNAGDVSKLVNNAGWNVFQNNVTTAKKDTVTAGNNVAFNNGTYTTVNVTSDGTNTTITYDANIGDLTNNANGTVNEGDISPNSLATAAGVAKAINNSGWVTQVDKLDPNGNPVLDANGKPVKEDKLVKPGSQVNYVAGQGTTAQTTVDPKTGALSVSYSVNGTTGNVGDAGTANVADPNAYLNAGEVAKLVNGVSWTVDSKTDATTANAATKNTYKASAKVKAGDTVRINAGRNIEISGEGRNINIATSDNPSFANVNVAGTVKANKVDANDVVAGNSLTVGTGAGATKITSSPEGLKIAKSDGSPQRILNVAPGQADTDAVNVSQLKGAIGNVNNRINKLNKQRKAGHASSMAAGNLMQAYREGQSVVTAGVGQYQGQTGLAVGYSRISDSGKVGIKLSAGVNSQKEVSGAASVGYFW